MHANEKAMAELALSNGTPPPFDNETPVKKPKLEKPIINGHKEDSISALVEVNENTEQKKIFSCSICKEKFSSR